MNKENILKLADFIEAAHYKFDMASSTASPECKTGGCIAGHAAVLWSNARDICRTSISGIERFSWNNQEIEKILGLDILSQDRLFITTIDELGCNIMHDDITREMAVATLRRLAETEEIYFNTDDDKENENE